MIFLLIIVVMLMIVLPLLARQFFTANTVERTTFLEPVAEISSEKKQTISDVIDITLLPLNNQITQKELFSEFSANTILVVPSSSNQFFRGYELLQALQNVNLILGEKKLFHYFKDSEILFSVSPIKEPYCFDLEEMGGFITTGLKFSVKFQMHYHIMKEVAEKLAEELEGEIQEFSHVTNIASNTIST